MDRTISSRATTRRFFESGFSAGDIAEYLISYDAIRPADEVRERMRGHDFDVVGVRDDGFVIGYVAAEDLVGAECREHLRYFGSDDLIDADASLCDVIQVLGEREFMFVKVLGGVGGIVTRADLQKPPVRMWLFGVITLLEDAFGDIVRADHPGNAWREHLSPTRVELAEKFQAERQRRNESLDLVSCLQFGDKAHIVFKDADTREIFGFESRKAAREAIKRVELLRNSLAHAQDIVRTGLPTIVNISHNLDRVLQVLEVRAMGRS